MTERIRVFAAVCAYNQPQKSTADESKWLFSQLLTDLIIISKTDAESGEGSKLRLCRTCGNELIHNILKNSEAKMSQIIIIYISKKRRQWMLMKLVARVGSPCFCQWLIWSQRGSSLSCFFLFSLLFIDNAIHLKTFLVVDIYAHTFLICKTYTLEIARPSWKKKDKQT